MNRTIMHLSRVLPAALLIASPLVAQSEFGADGPFVAPSLAPSAGIERLESTRRFGYSGAVNAMLVAPGTVLGGDELAGLGAGWEYGHRWVPVRNENASGLPGTPIGAPAEAQVDIGEAMSLDEVRTPFEAGVWLLESGTGSSVTVITQVPASRVQGGRLNGYHIGHYPTAGSGRTDAYAPPAAFIEVTPENRDFQISEHLRLSQFITKDQFDVWPKYVALDPRLLDKLELVMQELNAMGVRADRMHVMSGFRTPQYNGPGGDGRAALSRHMWGDAADVWIDNLGTGLIDDLNGDGMIGKDDAALMLKAVERVERRYPELIGGAGVYSASLSNGPFIHIDVRGQHSRW